ncbi:MAG: DUF309 domain-containing protein [Planctomycetaceae bacterium]
MQHPSPNSASPPRYAPQLQLPPYTYVPGLAPHPISSPQGHSYQHHPSESPPLNRQNWQTHDAYLSGIDLWNFGYYWEAHEIWESAWKSTRTAPSDNTPKSSSLHAFLQALIKLAAAGVKRREGNATGTERHLLRAIELFTPFLSENSLCGLEIATICHQISHLSSGKTPWLTIPTAKTAAPLVIFPFQITINSFVK